MFAPRLPQKLVKVGRKPNVNVKKIAVVDFVDLTFLLGENQPHLKINFRRRGKVESAGLILAHCCGSIGLRLTRNETCQNGSADLVLAKLETQLNCTVSSRKL